MNNYEYGFITKCAEYGVDPESLVKVALSWDDIKNTASSGIESVGNFAKNTFNDPKNRNAIIGGALGYLLSNATRKGIKGYDKAGIHYSDLIGAAAGGFLGYNADRLLNTLKQ